MCQIKTSPGDSLHDISLAMAWSQFDLPRAKQAPIVTIRNNISSALRSK